ncbi:hypothetical protein, partial [Klebsiella aerogenes]|uniref:hypothetical protein n=1 Tax=Klebsiella aerogenes TaxID=548 RepID=UPI0021A2B73F
SPLFLPIRPSSLTTLSRPAMTSGGAAGCQYQKYPVPPAGIFFPDIIPFAKRAFALQKPPVAWIFII